ncbi:hypothetical protein FPANT_3871 [Fusarium pseudoanthophilum]|uniref:Uncharacterized protein n=1 Tax=Fusarium pseudoanthophilum TaxID=48495 RepID=A0A8H5PJS8_9HYPO|nr:hypothetical protein FPANT_3871 [Fusarium pseudoanthophilum]
MDTTSQDVVNYIPDGASDDSLDSSQARDVPERDTPEDPEPRVFNICGLCKFRFHEGQAIITVDRNNSTLPLTWNEKYYPENEIFHPRGQKAFHAGCFQVAGDAVFVKGFLESCTWNLVRFGLFHGSFTQPPPSAVAKRTRWLRSSLSLEVRHAIKNRLPTEVCESIAAYCLSEYATKLHLDAWKSQDPSDPDDDLTLPVSNGQTVWAQYVEIEGCNYVKSLSTVRMNEDDTMVFTAKKNFGSSMELGMYFAEDSLGVRSVVACSDDEIRGTEEPGLRWAYIPRRCYNLPLLIRMRFDGLKLRNLDVTHYEREYYVQRTRWAVLPRDLRHLKAPDDNIPDCGHRAAVHAVDWNLPGVSGYAIGLRSSSINSIVPYRPGKLPSALIDAYDDAESTFLYFPVDPEERISELWLRSGDFPYDDDSLTRAESLIVLTSNGRSLVLGPDFRSPRSDRSLDYEAIADLSSTTPTRTLYYKYSHNESWLGFERMTTWHNRKIKVSFEPPIWPGPYYWFDQFFSTSAELENLRTITPCRGWRHCVDDEIFGLLFTYADGRQRSVGRIRLDHLQEPVNITSDRFWIGSSGDTEPDEEEPDSPTGHIIWLGVCKPIPNADIDMQFLEIPLRGELEWRSTWGAAITKSAVHLGDRNLQSEMDQVLAHEAASGAIASKTAKTFSVRTGEMCLEEE